MSVDARIFLEIYGGATTGSLKLLMITLTIIGSGWSMFALLPMMYSQRTRKLALMLTGLLTANAALVAGLKLIVRRPRPWIALGVVPLWDAPTDYSCPSGHAAGSFAFAAFFATLAASNPRNRSLVLTALIALPIAFAIATSRVYLGVHYPLDVTAGAVVGTMMGIAGGRLYAKTVRKQDQVKGNHSPDIG